MSNEKSPLVGPTITVDGGVKEEELKKKKKKKEGKGSYLAYGVLATTLYLGFVAKNRNGIFTSPSEAANLLRSSTTIDALLLQDTLLSSDTSTCTPLHRDPHDPKSTGPCCKGLQPVNKDWDGDKRFYYKCQPDSPCGGVICVDKRIDETYTCGPTTDTKVCYPKTTPSGLTKLPVVFYNRDSWGWGGGPDYREGTKSWLTEMAEQCLIVIAPKTPQTPTTDKNEGKCKRDHDLLLAYNYIKIPENWSGKGSNRWNISRVTPDWESVGAAGQSSGAHHLPWFQREFGEERMKESDKKTKKLKAVLYGHGGGTQKEGKMRTDLPKCLADTKWCDGVPAFFLTSTDDTQVHPSGTYGWYQKLTGQDTAGGKPHVQHVVYAQVKQLTNDPPSKYRPQWGHMEPVTPHSYHGGENGGGYGVLNTYTAKFMACHLYSDTNQANIHKEACAWIYGSSDGSRGNICETASSLVDGCHLKQPK